MKDPRPGFVKKELETDKKPFRTGPFRASRRNVEISIWAATKRLPVQVLSKRTSKQIRNPSVRTLSEQAAEMLKF